MLQVQVNCTRHTGVLKQCCTEVCIQLSYPISLSPQSRSEMKAKIKGIKKITSVKRPCNIWPYQSCYINKDKIKWIRSVCGLLLLSTYMVLKESWCTRVRPGTRHFLVQRLHYCRMEFGFCTFLYNQSTRHDVSHLLPSRCFILSDKCISWNSSHSSNKSWPELWRSI